MACDRVRIGGTISGSTLSGGTLIESQAIGLLNWNGMYGHPGFKGGDWAQFGQDGEQPRPSKRYAPRFPVLTIAVWDRTALGTVTAPGGRCEELDDNLDTFMGLIDGDSGSGVGQFILERDQTDGTTRWIACELNGPVTGVQGPVFGSTTSAYTFVVPLRCAYPMWQSEVLNSTTLSGPDSLIQLGNGRIANAVLTYAGAGVLTIFGEAGGGYTLETTGAAVVDVGNFTVTSGGLPVDNLLIPSRPWWANFRRNTTVTSSTVSVGVSYRDHWLT